MNTNIKSSRISGFPVQPFRFRHLAAALAVALCGAVSMSGQIATKGPNGENVYYLSGNPGNADPNAVGTKDKPAGAIFLKKNDVIILDASKTTNPNFTPFTPWVAIDPSIEVASLVSNGASSAYQGWQNGDPSARYIRTPYVRLNELIDKTPSLAELMPVFFTQSDPVYISKPIKQSNEETPDWVKQDSKYGSSAAGYNVWPVAIYSSDAFDPTIPTDVALAPRGDMQNAAWVVLASSGDTPAVRVQLMDYYGDYSPAGTGGATSTQGNYSMVTLEHVIFQGGRTTGAGGAILFRRTDNIANSGLPNARSTINIKGDVAFVGNFAGQLGGAINAQESHLFDGNVYFVGNMAGAQYNTATGGIFLFDTAGGGSYHGSGGALRAGSGNQTITFSKDAIFIGNLAAGEGGAISTHNNATVNFLGKTVFMGNMSGFYAQKTLRRGGGNGGAIVFGDSAGNKMNFQGDSYFIGNQAGGMGGAIATDHGDCSGQSTFWNFTAPAIFTDNVSGYRPEQALITVGVEASKIGGVFTPPANVTGTITTIIGGEGKPTEVWQGMTTINVFSGTNAAGLSDYGAKVRAGGAIGSVGAYLFFDTAAPVSFERNNTNGNGGALYLAKNNTSTGIPSAAIKNMAASFYADTSFVGNVADVNGGAIQTGLYGTVLADDFNWAWNNNVVTPAAVYFGKAGAGTTLTMRGNLSYSENTVKAIHANQETVYEMPLFGGGAVFSIGGFYVESMYSIMGNQTKGSGGGILIGSSTATPAVVQSNMGKAYSLVLNPLDWKPAGSYSQAGNWALLQDNVAMKDGGAIASHDGSKLYIGSGAKFINNYAGGQGGAIALGVTSQSIHSTVPKDAPVLDLRARVDDIIFSGNRAGAAIDTSSVDIDHILDPLRDPLDTSAYMQVNATSGRANDIYVGAGALNATGSYAGIINMDAYAGMKIFFDGGIDMLHSGTKNLAININTMLDVTSTSIGAAATTSTALANTTPVGLVMFDNASADIEGITTVGSGTLRIQGTSNNLHWGTGTSTARADTLFDLKGPAALEANATINANTIKLGDGATLRVLGNGATPGTLTLNAGAGGVVASSTAKLNLAGNGHMNLGLASLDSGQIVSISVGDTGHTAAQTLTLAKDAGTLAAITLNNTKLTLGLFSGNQSDKVEADGITIGSGNSISLTSLAQGTFTIATGLGSGITGTPAFAIDYKGTALSSYERISYSTSIASGNTLQLVYSATNAVMNWNSTSGEWDASSANWTSSLGTKYTLGDVVNFGSGHAGNISVAQNVIVSGMNVEDNYTFQGAGGITTQSSAWGGSAQALATGTLTMSGIGKTLALDNATGAGQRNEFTGGILITGGTVAAGNAAQLGAALSQITFANTANNGAALLVTNTMVLDGAASMHSQRLDIAANNTASVSTGAAGNFNVINNAAAGNGGVFNVGTGATLNLNAQGSMAFLNNTAAQGGALHLADNATANIDVASDKTVMFGLQGNRTFKTAANVTSADSIGGTASSVINKNGLGILSINSNSSDFAGTLNVKTGSLMFGEGTQFGNASSRIIVSSGALIGGAATIGGNLTVNGGKLSIDAGEALGRADADSQQTFAVKGDLSLAGASVIYNSVINKSGEYFADVIKVGGIVDITGITTFDFDNLNTGITTLIQSANYIGVNGNNALVNGGLFATTDDNLDTVLSGTDFIVKKSGVVVDEARYKTSVEYAFAYSEVVTESLVSGSSIITTSTYFTKGPIELAEGVTLVSQTNFYDTGKLQLDATVANARLYWTGESGSTWNTKLDNWHIPVAADKTFATGDSIVFGATSGSGTLYDEGIEARRIIEVDPANNVRIADMTITGTGNWTFTGGYIIAIPGANNYKDENGADLSTGQMILDTNFTGTVTLANAGINFKGVYKLVSGTLMKLPDVEVRNGTLVATAGKLGENRILNNSLIVLNQGSNETFKAQISGTGDILQTLSGTSANKITLADTGFIGAKNYHLAQGQLQVSAVESLAITGTLTIDPGAGISVNNGINAGLIINNGFMTKSQVNGEAQKPPSSLGDSDHLRDPGVGDTTVHILGNYHSDGGTLLLHTFRDAAMINNFVVYGNSSGTSHVVIRNISSLDTGSETGVTISGTGIYYRPDGRPDSINPIAAPKRDSLIFATLGSQRNLKLVMDGNDWAQSILPTATIGSTVPFATVISGTYEVVTTTTRTTTITASGTDVASVVSLTTTPLWSNTSSVHYFNQDGTIAPLVASSTLVIGSGTAVTSSTTPGLVGTGTTIIVDVIVTTSTDSRTTSSVTYEASDLDYSESRDNYKLVQGRDGNWYIRNASIAPTDADLPMIGAAPMVAALVAQNDVKAIHQHINARHDALQKGWVLWSDFTHNAERVRKEYYNGTRLKQEHFHVGADYAFVSNKADQAYSTAPSISVGAAYGFTSVTATRNDKSTLSANVNSLTGYASARWWRLYLDVLAEYAPDASYKAELDASVPFDVNGTVKGSRTGMSAELGIITNPKGLGQLEFYSQVTSQKHDFGSVSSLNEPVDLTNSSGYNPIYDPTTPNGRRYSFDAPTTLRAEGGFRWGSHLAINERWAARPWAGLAGGRISNSDYNIWLDSHKVGVDMNSSYFTVQGGAAAVYKKNFQFYLTYGFTGGDATNNYTLSTGVNYHW